MNEKNMEDVKRFEEIFTQDEVDLNNRLIDECTKKYPDFTEIEKLLQQGANPLGATGVSGWELFEQVYSEVLINLRKWYNLPRITELFLAYGMDIDNPKIPYDQENCLNPMWFFGFLTNEFSICALEMLLNHGLSAESAREMWSHATTNLIFCECGDLCNDRYWNYVCTWTMKMLMLCASYDHVVNNDEHLRHFIDCSINNYDLHKFRKWNNFDYVFDTSRCNFPETLSGTVVKIYEKSSKKEVWKIGLNLKAGTY